MRWYGDPPFACELCGERLPRDGHFVDGRTVRGFWALMCALCHEVCGVGLGLGRGQAYNRRTWEKIR